MYEDKIALFFSYTTKYKIKGETFADAANEMQKESEERVNDSISKRGLNDSMMKLMLEREKVRSTSKMDTYNNMFAGCSNLNYINASFLTEPSDEYTNNWVSGVSETGTFVKNANDEYIFLENGLYTFDYHNKDFDILDSE